MARFARKSPLFSNRPNFKSIGFVRRVGFNESIASQIELLKEEGCCLIIEEVCSSRSKELKKSQLQQAIDLVDKGDELIVASLAHIGSSQVEVLTLLNDLLKKGKHFRSLDGYINTREMGEISHLLLRFFYGLTEVEKLSLKLKKQATLQYRIENGLNLGGRPKTNMAKAALVLRLRGEGCSYRSIRDQTGLALSTIGRIIVDNNAGA